MYIEIIFDNNNTIWSKKIRFFEKNVQKIRQPPKKSTTKVTVISKTWVTTLTTLKMKDFPKMFKNKKICETSNLRNFFPNWTIKIT